MQRANDRLLLTQLRFDSANYKHQVELYGRQSLLYTIFFTVIITAL